MKKIHRSVKYLLAALFISLLTACGSTTETVQPSSEGTNGSADEKYVLTLSHFNQTTTPHHLNMEWFNEELQKRSNGRLSLQIYPAAQLMPPTQEIQALLEGQIDMTYSLAPYMASYDPIWYLFDLPFLMENDPADPAVFMENRHKFSMDENGGRKIMKMMEAKGLKVLSLGTHDSFVSPFATNPDVVLGDMTSYQGKKIRTTGGKMIDQTLKGVGGNPIFIDPNELSTALQQNVVDALVTSPNYVQATKLPVKNFTPIPITTSMTPLVMSLNKFESLPRDLQDILVETGRDYEVYAKDKAIEMVKATYQEFEKMGVNIYYPTPEEIKELEDATRPVWDSFAKEVSGAKELIDVVEKMKQ